MSTCSRPLPYCLVSPHVSYCKYAPISTLGSYDEPEGACVYKVWFGHQKQHFPKDRENFIQK